MDLVDQDVEAAGVAFLFISASPRICSKNQSLNYGN